MPGALAAADPAFRNRYWLIAQGSAVFSLHSYGSAAVIGACLAADPGKPDLMMVCTHTITRDGTKGTWQNDCWYACRNFCLFIV